MGIEFQRSIPFPRINVKRLADYMKFVVEVGGVELRELRARGLDFGKGRGDITRFLERIGLVIVDGDLVMCTEACLRFISLYSSLGDPVLHAMLAKRVPQYRLLVNVVKTTGTGTLADLYTRLEEEIKKLSPSTWINSVAFKALLGFARDLGVVEVKNGMFSYLGDPLRDAVGKCLGGGSTTLSGADIGVTTLGELDKCLGYKTKCCRTIPSPGRSYCVVEINCLVEEIYQQV